MKRAFVQQKILTTLILLFIEPGVVILQANLLRTSQDSPGLTGTEAKALLEKVAETYRNLKRYEFHFTLLTEVRSAAGRKSVETNIELTSFRPDKLRMLISGGLGELQVYSDGMVSWVFAPPLKQYTRKVTTEANGKMADGASRFA